MAKFKCWDDCTIAGCPGHEVECREQRSVNLLHFKIDQHERLIPEPEFVAMVEAYNASKA